MTGPRLTWILATSALAVTLAGSIVTPSQAMPLPVTSAQEIAGAAPTEHVQWWGGYGWRGYGWGWRRPYYGGGALAAGLIGGLALGSLAASAGSYYGYGYPAYGYGYSYYPSSYAYPSYYSYPGYYRTAYYGTSYGWGYGSTYWASGKRVQKHARKPVRR
jgi:hypothetical protein